MKILLLGKNGQVGRELQRSLTPIGHVVALDRRAADLEQPQTLIDAVTAVCPDVIVNAAAYTAVDKAEEDIERAYAVNTKAVDVLAREAARRDVWLVHYSSDYVFDGRKTEPYVEDDDTNPLNVYGKSKLAGEQAIRARGARHLIFRTSWIYASRGRNFVRTILQLARECSELRVVADQIGAPTGAGLVADITAFVLAGIHHEVQSSKKIAKYHLTSMGQPSWHEFAQVVLAEAAALGAQLRARTQDVAAVRSDGYPTRANRPANSCLATDKLRNTFGVSLPDWREGVTRVVQEILAPELQ